MQMYGKIFVVVAVLVVILAGIFVYLVSIDRKVNRLRKEVEEKNSREQTNNPG
jgi:CcmD family protein